MKGSAKGNSAMGYVDRDTRNMVPDSNPQRQHNRQIDLAFGSIDVLHRDGHLPTFSKRSGVRIVFLARQSAAFGQDGARLGIPSERVSSGFGKKSPDAVGGGVYRGKRADADGHTCSQNGHALLSSIVTIRSELPKGCSGNLQDGNPESVGAVPLN